MNYEEVAKTIYFIISQKYHNAYKLNVFKNFKPIKTSINNINNIIILISNNLTQNQHYNINNIQLSFYK